MKTAFQKDGKLLREIRQAQYLMDQLHIWWLGQSGFLIHWNDSKILFDPYLSDSLTKKYAETDKPHVRMTEQVIEPGRLVDINIVTSTHNHTDHLDADTLTPLIKANPDMVMIIPEANRDFVVDRLGCAHEWPQGMNDQMMLEVNEIRIHGIPAAHTELERDDQGRCVFMGYVVEIGPWTVYHSGDTIHYDEMEELLKIHEIDVALLPINGNLPERNVAGNLDGKEAAQLAHDIGAGTVIPCHYDMFEFNSATTDLFESKCKALGQNYRILENGEQLTVE
jgi:L-ascorbate metabolism protein UlaG (beta-lactamase superfamily)